MRRRERKRDKKKKKQSCILTMRMVTVLSNIRCEAKLTLNAQLCCNLALFGKGNLLRCLQLVLQAVMTWSAFSTCLFSAHERRINR